MKKLVVFRFLLVTLILALMMPAAFAQADQGTPLAKTAPPPNDFSILTVFDPDYLYLENGRPYIFSDGDNKVRIAGDTLGTIRVDEIGVMLTLQRWTGSAWIDVFFGGSVTDTDSAYIYSSNSNLEVESGYYYRTKSYHWIEEGSTTEDGYRYSNNYLVP
ncbi:hypothetical protein [Cohnella hongkongensis]|uniref:Uncharacterized protein n=1 Tax=Cohnella hongkongensis TaxID=178337 RepID=A0ABV9FGZ2_9BACL